MLSHIDPRWAWEPYKPTPQAPWNLQRVGHLFRRAAFGANWGELQAALTAGPEKTVDDLLKGGPDGPAFPESIRKGNAGGQLPAWWLLRILESKNPLREKLAIFWHNHFATSNAKVNNAGYMIGMYDLLYEHTLGNFRDLLQAVSKDPAMMVWLDTATSKKGMPNENYARELMELFSLGIGNYTEDDIREAAKAFTGWEIKDRQYHFNAGQHDGSEKTVLREKGKWNGQDIVRICLDQKPCPNFVAGKLFRFLVSETIAATPELLAPLAEQFRKSGFDFGAMVATVLRSNLFFSDQAYRTRVKSPVDFAVGIIRGLEGRVPPAALAQKMDELGQRLFYPPSVKGWDGGPAWLNGQTLLFRQNFALALTAAEDPALVRMVREDETSQRVPDPDPARLVRRQGKKSDGEVVDFFLQLFLQGDLPAISREKLVTYLGQARKQKPLAYRPADDDAPVRAVCHLVLTLPEFQLD